MNHNFLIKRLLDAEYQQTHDLMLKQTLQRIDDKKQGNSCSITDELWVVEHQDVYTLGQAGKEEHILMRTDTPIIKTDRGGQVTWHGKGQLVMYWLFDLTELGWKVRDLVSHAEQAIEDVINSCINQHDNNYSMNLSDSINSSDSTNPNQSNKEDMCNFNDSLDKGKCYYAKARQDAPGVYIYDNEHNMLGKIASLGFKIKQGFSYHGIAVNLECDLLPFTMINPCGYANMQMLRLQDFTDNNELTMDDVTNMLIDNISLRHGGMISLRD